MPGDNVAAVHVLGKRAYVGFRGLVFEYSIRDFFECQNIVEACWFSAFFTQFCEVFECQNVVLACWLRC